MFAAVGARPGKVNEESPKRLKRTDNARRVGYPVNMIRIWEDNAQVIPGVLFEDLDTERSAGIDAKLKSDGATGIGSGADSADLTDGPTVQDRQQGIASIQSRFQEFTRQEIGLELLAGIRAYGEGDRRTSCRHLIVESADRAAHIIGRAAAGCDELDIFSLGNVVFRSEINRIQCLEVRDVLGLIGDVELDPGNTGVPALAGKQVFQRREVRIHGIGSRSQGSDNRRTAAPVDIPNGSVGPGALAKDTPCRTALGREQGIATALAD